MKRLFPRLPALFCAGLIIFCSNTNLQASDTTADKIFSDLKNRPKEELFKDVLYAAERIKDPFSRYEALIEVSRVYAELGRYAEAEYVLPKILDICKNTENKFLKAVILSGLADTYISLKEDEKALDIAKKIEFSDSRNDAFLKIIDYYAREKQYEKALELTKAIDGPFPKAWALYKLINEAKNNGSGKEAIKINRAIGASPAVVKRFLRKISLQDSVKFKTNLIDNFIFLDIPSARLIIEAQKEISLKLYGPAEDALSGALLSARDIKTEFFKNGVLAQIALGYAQIGQYERALRLADSLKLAYFRNAVAAQIALGYVQIGQYERALRLADSIANEYLRSTVLTQIAIGYARSGKFEESLKLTERIITEYLKEEALSQIIIQYIKNKRESNALRLADSIASPFSRDRLYAVIADYYVQSGEYEKASRVSKRIEDYSAKLKILLSILEYK